MIRIHTADDGLGGVWLTVEGHSEPTRDVEHTRACAGVSALVVTLAALLGVTPDDAGWSGDHGGHVRVCVPKSMILHLEFVLYGLFCIESAYESHCKVERKDTTLFTSEETKTWDLETYPPPPLLAE